MVATYYGMTISEKMFKPLIRTLLLASSLFFLFQSRSSSESLVTNSICDPIRSRLVMSILDKVKRLPGVSEVDLSCKSISKINSIEDDAILLTTTRKRGNEYICLHASGNTRPCQVKVGLVTSQENPNDVLCTLMQKDCSAVSEGPLTETVERLYLRPSSLIR